MELKQILEAWRTELKQKREKLVLMRYLNINRTSMELKRTDILIEPHGIETTIEEAVIILIEPLWN
jgi:hypothetical protein